jgi:hypothetical protein
MEQINVEIAINQYKKHLEAVKRYQKENPDKMSIKAKRYYENKKTSNPEAYKQMLDKKKEQYKNRKLQKVDIPILQ